MTTKSTAITHHGPILAVQDQVEDITRLLKAIIEPWDLYVGVCSYETMHWSEHSILIQISVVVFVENAYAFSHERQESEPSAPIYEFPPKLRIVCASRNPPKGSDNERPFRDCITATHDLGPRATARLVEFLRIEVRSAEQGGRARSFQSNREEYLECQQLMIDDVWSKFRQKLDAWQQLYVLACVKSKLRHTWFIRES
jgi:hypothetical protein